MADNDDLSNLGDGSGGDDGKRKSGGFKSIIPQILKWVAIAIAAVIFIVTICVIVVSIMNKGGKKAQQIPVATEYIEKREVLDWYTSLDQIRCQTNDPVPSSVVVQVNLGYKKDDKAAAAEITARSVEIRAFLRRYFSSKTKEELEPYNEDVLRQQIRDQINDDYLTSSRIRDVQFTSKDVITN